MIQKLAPKLLLLVLIGCVPNPSSETIDRWKSEVLQTEKAFNDMAQERGIATAFEAFAAEEGVIKRRGELIKGKTAIAEWYRKDARSNETLTWKPDFVDVSTSGDLAYTYGSFVFTQIDSTGARKESTGYFHTVWKRQADGNWKFVWD